MNLHKHQLYLLEQHSESFKVFSASIKGLTLRVNPLLWIWPLYMLLVDGQLIDLTTLFIYVFMYPPLLKSTNTTYSTKCKQATYCTKYW